jgi:tetratricopeptide (TPR) repeat protein
MSKRSKNPKKRKPKHGKRPQPNAFDPASIVENARIDFADRNYRRAREGFRRLLKTDAEVFGPLYVQATLGYITELLKSGRIRQADDVANQTRTLIGEYGIGSSGLNGLELRLAACKGQWSQAASLGTALWIEAENGRGLDVETRLLVADALVLAFKPVTGADGEDGALTQEAEAIGSALQAMADCDWTNVEDLLRPIGRQSPFSEWKQLIKGMAAFYTQDHARAARFFECISSDRVPGRAARAFQSLTQSTPSENEDAFPSGDALSTALLCHLVGEPEAAAYMPAVQESWEKEKLDKAFMLLQQRQSAFPCIAHGLWGRMTDLFLFRPRVSQDAFAVMAERLMMTAVGPRRFQSDQEKAALCRWAALEWEPHHGLELCEFYWGEFLAAYESCYGRNDRLASRVHARIANDLLVRASRNRPEKWEFKLIRKHASASLERDGRYLPAYWDLLQAYSATGMHRERNKLLDKLTLQFPEEKMVLLEAGRRCAERKAFVKGIAMLEKALALDPLDSELIGAFVEALGEQAFHLYKKHDLKRGRACFEKMEPHLVDSLENFERGRTYQSAKQGVFEMMYAPKEGFEDLIIRNINEGPSDTVMFVTSLMSERYFPKNRLLKGRSLNFGDSYLTGPGTNGADAVRMIKALKHYESLLPMQAHNTRVGMMQQYLRNTIENGRISLEEARKLIMEQRGFRYELFATDIVEIGLEHDPNDLFMEIADISTTSYHELDEDDLEDLRDLVRRAEHAGDRLAAEFGRFKLREIESFLETQRRRLSGPMDGGPALRFFDDEAEDEEDEGEEMKAELDRLESEFPGMRNLLQELAFMSPKERERKRREIGIPREAFDAIVQFSEMFRQFNAIKEGDEEDSPLEISSPPRKHEKPQKPKPRRSLNPVTAILEQLKLFS